MPKYKKCTERIPQITITRCAVRVLEHYNQTRLFSIVLETYTKFCFCNQDWVFLFIIYFSLNMIFLRLQLHFDTLTGSISMWPLNFLNVLINYQVHEIRLFIEECSDSCTLMNDCDYKNFYQRPCIQQFRCIWTIFSLCHIRLVRKIVIVLYKCCFPSEYEYR